eukprot:15437795-Alexandrium_andersonii.AAC.1
MHIETSTKEVYREIADEERKVFEEGASEEDYLRKKAGVPVASAPLMPAPTPGAAAPTASSPAPSGAKAP